MGWVAGQDGIILLGFLKKLSRRKLFGTCSIPPSNVTTLLAYPQYTYLHELEAVHVARHHFLVN